MPSLRNSTVNSTEVLCCRWANDAVLRPLSLQGRLCLAAISRFACLAPIPLSTYRLMMDVKRVHLNVRVMVNPESHTLTKEINVCRVFTAIYIPLPPSCRRAWRLAQVWLHLCMAPACHLRTDGCMGTRWLNSVQTSVQSKLTGLVRIQIDSPTHMHACLSFIHCVTTCTDSRSVLPAPANKIIVRVW